MPKGDDQGRMHGFQLGEPAFVVEDDDALVSTSAARMIPEVIEDDEQWFAWSAVMEEWAG
jgi:hypothetical protein